MTSDVQRSISFFVELGFTTAFLDDQDNPRYAGLRRDDVEIHIQWNELPDAGSGQDRPVYRFLVRDVDALYREFSARAERVLAAAQATPWHMPANTPWGTREFHVRDPSGNGLQFYQSPSPPNPSGA
ncbi:MAG: VOC family protein [Acidobacteria bacterium]|nr:VOC family protein [Acidobacteriota bacterium]